MAELNIFQSFINRVKQLKRADKTNCWFIVLIFAANILVFFPAFFHIARSEQNLYLYEVSDIKGLDNLLSFSYSYARTRLFAPGDTFLFRPLLYDFFAIQKWLFGYHFILWQLTAILLHLAVVWQLLRVLIAIFPSYFAHLFVLNFSLLYISQEMVIWHHMSPILLQLFLILMTFNHLIRYINSNQTEHYRIKWMLVYLTLASLIHEYALIVNFVFFVTLFTDRIRSLIKDKTIQLLDIIKGYIHFKYVWRLCIPPIIFLSMSAVDYFFRFGVPVLQPHSIHILKSIKYCLEMFFLSIITPILPGYLYIGFTEESPNRLTENFAELVHIFDKGVGGGGVLENLNFILLILFVLISCFVVFGFIQQRKILGSLVTNNFGRSTILTSQAIALIAFLLSVGYVAMVVLARLSYWGFNYINSNLFYLYPVILFNQIFLYFIFMIVLSKATFNQFWIKRALLLVFLLSICLNGYKNFQLNRMVQEDGKKNLKKMILGVEPYYKFQNYSLGGELLFERGQYDKSLEYLNKASVYYSKSNTNAKVRATIFYLKGMYDLAIQEANKIIATDPTFYDAYTIRALCYCLQRDDETALKDFMISLKLKPAQPALYNDVGNIYNRQRKFDLAIENYNQAIKQDPNLAVAYYNRGVAYISLQNYDLALENFNQVIAIDPQYQKAYVQRGIIYQLTNQLDEALREYDQVLKLNPSAGLIYFKKSEIFKIKADKKQAMVNVLKASQYNYSVDQNYLDQLNDMQN